MKLNRKILRTMKENKARYFGSVLLIMISCALYTAFNITVPNLKTGIDEYKKNSMLEDAQFMTQEPITNIPSLEEEYDLLLEERYSWDYEYREDVILRILSDTDQLNRYSIVEGNTINGEQQLIIDSQFAKSHGLNIGDHIDILGKEYTIQGFAALPDYIYPLKNEEDMVPNANNFGLAIMNKSELEDFNRGHHYYMVKFNLDNRDEFKEKLSETNFVTQWLNQKDNPRITFINGDINAFSEIGRIVPVVILVLTCVLIAAVLSRLLNGEYIQIGTLYGLGYTRMEILRHYLMYAVIISLTGSIIGTFIGQFLAKPLMLSFTFQYTLPEIDMDTFILEHVVVSLLLPFVFLVVVTYLVVRKALWLTPRELMRGKQGKNKIGWLERNLKLERFSFDIKYRIRGMVRGLSRILMMILGIMFASMLLLMGFTTQDSIDYLFEHSIKDTFTYEHFYMFNEIQFEEVDHGERVSISTFERKQDDGEFYNFSIYGIEEDAKLINLLDQDKAPIPKDQIIITQSLANNLDIEAGDSIDIKNTFTSKELKIQIDAVADTYVGEYIFMPLDEFNRLNGYPENSYTGIMSSQQLDIEPTSLLFSQTNKELVAAFEEATKPVTYMVGSVSVVAFILGLIIIFMITSLMIEENKTNISLLKVLGYSKRKIYSLLLGSNVIFVIIGFLLAIPLILFSVDAMFQGIAKDLKMTIPAHLKFVNILLSFVIIFVTYTLSNWFSRKQIMKVSMVEILKNRVE